MFPGEFRRVIYEPNPLVEVICQLRFPPILKIDLEQPAGFQERIRSVFPVYDRRAVPVLESGGELQQFLSLANFSMPPTPHDFATADGKSKVSLTSGFVSVTHTKYQRWEHFNGHVQLAVQALIAEYQPAFFTRVGLRYRDLINRKEIPGIENVGWTELISPELLGALSVSFLTDRITDSRTEFEFLLEPETSRARVRHGYGRDIQRKPQPSAYEIDADYFTTERTELNDLDGKLELLHASAGRLFHWATTDRLRAALNPTPVNA